MVDIVLLAGKLVLLALVYLFLLAAIRTGVGRISRSAAPGSDTYDLVVVRGPRELKGLRLPLEAPVVVGRSPGADIVIADDFMSSLHARIVPKGDSAVLEDLGSTNGTVLNGELIDGPRDLEPGDTIDLGGVRLTLERP